MTNYLYGCVFLYNHERADTRDYYETDKLLFTTEAAAEAYGLVKYKNDIYINSFEVAYYRVVE
jgi:hypothetical protein